MAESGSKTTFMFLALALVALASTSAMLFLALRPQQAAPVMTVDGKPVAATDVSAVTAFTQSDTVSPGTKYTGQVNYPIPFSTPPNLKIKAPDGKRVYEITKEDEFGFVWMIRPAADDFMPDAAKNTNNTPEALMRMTFESLGANYIKPNLKFEDFSYDAKGVRGGGIPQKPFVQTGTFNTAANTDGEVIYPIPYAGPANVEIEPGGAASYVIIVESRANGFKWKNKVEKSWENFASGSVRWTAKGMREKSP